MTISPEIFNLIRQIRDDRVHGASELARQAADVLKTAAKGSKAPDVTYFLQEMDETAKLLMSVRPAMAPVYNIVKQIVDITLFSSETDLDRVKLRIVAKADKEIENSQRSVEQIASHTSKLISPGDVIFTYSYSSTVMATLKEAYRRNGTLSVIVTRSGVGQAGLKTARLLAEAGVSVMFIDDTASGIYISKCAKVMVGADRIRADGSLVNAAGTYAVAVLAKRTGIPFYVLCETLKFDLRMIGKDVDLEEKEPAELVQPGTLPQKVVIKNPYFDVTPSQLITGVVTENGLMDKDEVIAHFSSLPAQAHP